MSKNKTVSVRQIVSIAVFITMVASAVVLAVSMILAPSEPAEGVTRVKSDYVLMLLQSILGIFAMLLPRWLSHKWGVEIPSFMMILYAVFLYCAIYLGEVRGFYYLIPYWDTILHTFSGVALGALGFSVLSLLNKTDRVPFNLSPAFVAVFAFCFAISVDVVWEIYEYVMDGAFAMNMQKHAAAGGRALIGRDALGDTMTDLIVDSVGALFISLVGYVSLKWKKGWIEKMLLRIRKKSH
ncbi:MAG: hypothetical protein IJP14_03695 [Clostridia bacterium]|nr:hypothetical protein [Clostridia bacterium]